MTARDDWQDLPKRMQPKSLDEAIRAEFRNMRAMYRRQKEHNEPLYWPETPAEFRGPDCFTCNDTRWVKVGEANWQTLYGPCPSCKALAQQEARERLNRRWPLSAWEEREARKAWDLRPDAPRGVTARNKQQAFLKRLPSSQTLFLSGPAGTGKSRLGVEVAVCARDRNLSSIYRTGERLRAILQAFPHKDDEPEVKAAKEKRLETANSDLRAADVLVIDEADHAAGPAIQETYLELLNFRIGIGLSTVFIANDHTKLQEPVLSRLRAHNNLWADLSGDRDARPLLGHGEAG